MTGAGDEYWANSLDRDRGTFAAAANTKHLLQRARAYEDYYGDEEPDKSAVWFGFAETLAEIQLLEASGERKELA